MTKTFSFTYEIYNPETEEVRYVDVENAPEKPSPLIVAEAATPEGWWFRDWHPFRYRAPEEILARIERLERAVTAQAQIIGRLDQVVSRQRSLILKLNMDFHRCWFVTLRRVRTGE